MELQPQQQSTFPTYSCGKCGSHFERRSKETVRCPECGYRIVYKVRTKKAVQYLAR